MTEVDAAPMPPAKSGGSDHRAEVMRLFMDATRARLAGEPQKAIQLYEACLKVDPRNHAAMFELGKLYHLAGNDPRSLELARKATDLDPDNIWYHFLLADLYMKNRQPDKAAAVQRAVVKRWPDRFEVYLDLANTLSMAGKYNEAGKVYRDIEARFGRSPQVTMQEFGMLANAGRMDEAERLLKSAMDEFPGETEFLALLAELYDSQGRHQEARELYLAVLEGDPDNSMVRVALAEHYYNEGDLDKAFEHLGLAFADPDLDVDAKMHVLLGFFEITMPGMPGTGSDREMLGHAYGLIETMQKAHPESGKPSTIKGDFLLRDGRYEEAREAFRHALRFEKDKYPIWQQVLQLGLHLGDHEGLEQDAAKATELFPLQPELHLYHGIALSQLERYGEAVEALMLGRDMVVDDDRLSAQFWSSLGDVYNDMGDHTRSDKAFSEALRLIPNDPTTLNNHAYYLSLRGDRLEKAEEMARRANELAPGQPSYQDTYAWVLFRMGRYEDARRWIEKAIASGGGEEGVIVEHYGDILFALGEESMAVEKWRQASELGGASDNILRKVQQGRPVE